METIDKQECPVCREKSLTLMEGEETIQDVGIVFVFGMKCDACELENGDVELEKPASKKQECTINNVQSLDTKVVRSGAATVKIPELKLKLTPGTGSKGYVGTVNDVVNEFISFVKSEKEAEEDKKKRKRLFNKIDELLDVQEGNKEVTLVIEDKSGNSVIVV